jgi:hypothetical protein
LVKLQTWSHWPAQFPAVQLPTRLEKNPSFLSCSSHDQDIADWLHNEPDVAGLGVFRDIDNTLPGEEWRRLTDLIALADAVVF